MTATSGRKKGRPEKPENAKRTKKICDVCKQAQNAVSRTRPCLRYAARITREIAEKEVSPAERRRGGAGYAELHETMALITAAFYLSRIPISRDLTHLIVILSGGRLVRFQPTKSKPAKSNQRNTLPLTEVALATALSNTGDPLGAPLAEFCRQLKNIGISCDWATAKKYLTPELRKDAARRKKYRENSDATREAYLAEAKQAREVYHAEQSRALVNVVRETLKVHDELGLTARDD